MFLSLITDEADCAFRQELFLRTRTWLWTEAFERPFLRFFAMSDRHVRIHFHIELSLRPLGGCSFGRPSYIAAHQGPVAHSRPSSILQSSSSSLTLHAYRRVLIVRRRTTSRDHVCRRGGTSAVFCHRADASVVRSARLRRSSPRSPKSSTLPHGGACIPADRHFPSLPRASAIDSSPALARAIVVYRPKLKIDRVLGIFTVPTSSIKPFWSSNFEAVDAGLRWRPHADGFSEVSHSWQWATVSTLFRLRRFVCGHRWENVFTGPRYHHRQQLS